jgi:kynurenine formamidase
MAIIDLSMPIEEAAFETFPTRIKRISHAKGARHLGWVMAVNKRKTFWANVLGCLGYLAGRRLVTRESFPEGEFISHEQVAASVHMGTHLDAPFHFGTRSEGQAAKKICDVPLEWCFSDGVLLDMRHKKPSEAITPEDVKEALKTISYTLKPKDIVLIRTDSDKLWPKREYYYKFPGMTPQAAEFLVKEGVKIIGVDFLGFDRPYKSMFKDFHETKNSSFLWPAHLIGRKCEYCHIERLTNLDKIPVPHGFKVACFPVKIKDAGASWVRAVAII